jgi:hypothetical protein
MILGGSKTLELSGEEQQSTESGVHFLRALILRDVLPKCGQSLTSNIGALLEPLL